MQQDKRFNLPAFISVYSIAHFLVDAACAFLMLGVFDFENPIFAMLLYNALAFAMQAPFGYLVDKQLNPRVVAVIGLTLIAAAYLFWNNPLTSISIAGIGNALYHVGGGSLVLSLEKRKATYAGIFTAPGAIGLAVGGWLAIAKPFAVEWIIPILLLSMGKIILQTPTPQFNRTKENSPTDKIGISLLLIACIMLPIVVRSTIGLAVEFPWKEDKTLLYILVSAVAMGKVAGGLLADKIGMLKTGIGGLIISAPLLAFYSGVPLLGISGTFALNLTMSVTLIAMLQMMPNYRGLAFGLTTVAIFIGALPSILGKEIWLKSDIMVLSLIFLASATLFATLRYMIKLKLLKA